MGRGKSIKHFLLVLVLAAVLGTTAVFSACTPEETGGGNNGGGNNSATVDQDLSMFDNVPHYGIEQVATYMLSIKGDNATFSNGNKTMKLVEKSVLPEIVLKNESEYVTGIKFTESGKTVEDYRFRMPSADAEIEILTSTEKPAYFKEVFPDGSSFDIASWGATGKSWEDSEKLIENNAPFTMNAEFSIAIDKANVDVNGNNEEDYLRGSIFKLSGVAGNMSRLLTLLGVFSSGTEEGIKAGESYTFTYNFENFGENTVSFRFYQAQGSIRVSDAVCVNAGQTITLAPGEHAGFKIAFTAQNDNHNIMPILEFRSDFDNEKLGIAIAKENKALVCSHNVQKIEAAEGDCGKAGNTEYYGCADCGAMWADETCETPTAMTDITKKYQHTVNAYAAITETTHREKCSECGSVVSAPKNHELTYRVVKEPTETDKGIKEEACDCGYKTGQQIEYVEKSTLTVIDDDGEQKQFTVKIDESLPDEAKTVLKDKFFDTETLEIYGKDGFAMPGHDIKVKNFAEQTGTALPPFGTDSQWAAIDKENGIQSQNMKDAVVRTEDGSKAYFGHQVTINANATTVVMRGHSPFGSTVSVNKITFHITLENKGEQTLKFNIGQINSEMTDIDGAYRENIVLEAGKSIDLTFTFPDNLGTNYEALTKLVFSDVDVTKPIAFSMAISYEEFVGDFKTLTVAGTDGDKTFSIEEGKPLLDEAKAVLDDKFYNTTTFEAYSADTFIMPACDIKVKNYDTQTGTVLLPFGSNIPWAAISNTSGIQSSSMQGATVKTQGGKSYYGHRVTINASAANVTMRGETPYGSNISVNNVKYYITIENKGEQTLKFNIGQINSGMNYIEGAYRNDIVLQTGESIDLVFTFPDGTGSNGNALTKFEFKEVDTSKPIIFAMTLSYEMPTE